jgi:hypothetical protein
MTIWQQAKSVLEGILDSLKKTPPDWKNAADLTRKLVTIVPGVERFEPLHEGQRMPVVNWRFTELRSDGEHLENAISEQDQSKAVGHVLSAMKHVSVLSGP